MGKSNLYKMPKRPLPKNTIFQADNLAVMKQLPSESIDLIYIDPPFNTKSVQKSKAWDSEVQGLQFYDSWGGGINSYVAFMRDRLEQMHRLLKKTGVLCVHLDYRAVHYIKVELDKIFGGGNSEKGRKFLINEVIWCYTSGGASNKSFSKKHDTILIYAKTKSKFKIFLKKSEKRYMGKKGYNNNLKILRDEKYCCLGPHTFTYPKDWWDDIGMLSTNTFERLGYPTQKPISLLNRIIEAFTREKDIVADFFCGCGTAISAAEKLSRYWLGVDASPEASKVMRKRMARDHGLEVKVTPLGKLTKEQVNQLDPFEFERYMVTCIGGVTNPVQRGDFGIDGHMAEDGAPIQVKKSKNVGRPVIQSFYIHLKQRGRGFIIAHSFSKTAKEEAVRLKNEEGLDLQLITTDQVIKIAA